MSAAPLPPRVIIVEPDHSARALARAALREAGYDAVGAVDVRQALQQFVAARGGQGRGNVRVVVIDHDALVGVQEKELAQFRATLGEPATVLVRRPTRAEPPGPWSLVLTRPIAVADIAAAVRRLSPLPADASRPLDLSE